MSIVLIFLYVLLSTIPHRCYADHYSVLGIPRDANAKMIKSTYRKQALRWHPDKHPPSQKAFASKKFTEISDAYTTLMDPEKRRMYDDRPGGWSFNFRDNKAGPNYESSTPVEFDLKWGIKLKHSKFQGTNYTMTDRFDLTWRMFRISILLRIVDHLNTCLEIGIFLFTFKILCFS